MAEDRKSVAARIRGKVQGVHYRAWTREKAEDMGLSGWVRNEEDGSVSALFDGPAGQVDAMLVILWDGPPSAEVEAIDIEEAEEPPRGFTILQ